jgi:hypothetical protein
VDRRAYRRRRTPGFRLFDSMAKLIMELAGPKPLMLNPQRPARRGQAAALSFCHARYFQAG